jgi:hypothetical protein
MNRGLSGSKSRRTSHDRKAPAINYPVQKRGWWRNNGDLLEADLWPGMTFRYDRHACIVHVEWSLLHISQKQARVARPEGHQP